MGTVGECIERTRLCRLLHPLSEHMLRAALLQSQHVQWGEEREKREKLTRTDDCTNHESMNIHAGLVRPRKVINTSQFS